VFPASAQAAEVSVIGLFPGKAVVSINGGPPRTLRAGQKTPEGIRLIGTDASHATLEIDGRQRRLAIGQQYGGGSADAGNSSVVLAADPRGHFFANGLVNGTAIRFLVDTGASTIALSAADARRARVKLNPAERGITMTANGTTQVYRVKLDTVTIGGITLRNVDAAVMENDMGGIALLGMSFLNRTEMHRDGQSMTLRQRY
jgi:aspartyl protease family protein